MAETTRTPDTGQPASKVEGPGPYVGIVRNHLDADYMGALEVEILKSTSEGNTPEASGEIVPVSYLSPFYGVTPFSGTSDNEGFDHTQKSYGFWAVPPDIGTKVLVIFAEGNRGAGFWIGCVQDQYMNFMVPGNASTEYNNEDQSRPRPVGEYNKRTEQANGNDPTQFLKPCHVDACAVLDRNGLAGDQIRGTTTSSARREAPSMVFGWSTPGPLDRRPGRPRVKSGEQYQQIEMPASRLTGHTLVMDDGDPSLFRAGPATTSPSVYKSLDQGGDPTIPANEMFRIRTRTGHQILLHNSEDLIYIAHGSGGSWIEMTANGKIDIYAKDSVSIHSENDFNFKADRDINLQAGNNINIKAGNTMAAETGANWTVKAGADGMLTCAGSSNIRSAHHKETAGAIDMNGPPAATAGAAPVPSRVPGNGAWSGAENRNPEAHTPARTNTDPQAVAAGTANTTSDNQAQDQSSSDTFRKCPPMAPAVGASSEGDEGEAAARANAQPSNNATLTSESGAGDEAAAQNAIANRQQAGSTYDEVGVTQTRRPASSGSASLTNDLDAFGGEGATVIQGVGANEIPGANSNNL